MENYVLNGKVLLVYREKWNFGKTDEKYGEAELIAVKISMPPLHTHTLSKNKNVCKII